MTHISQAIELEVSKAIRQFELVAGSYGLRLWRGDGQRRDYLHDVCLMRAHEDLRQVVLQLLGPDETVILDFPIRFTGQPGPVDQRPDDGLEVPVCRPELLTNHRIIVTRGDNQAAYEDELRLSWSSAKKLDACATDKIRSAHLTKISGRRLEGRISVTPEVRRMIEITTHKPEWPYAFGRDLESGVDSIFLHRKDAPKGYRFRIGDRLSATVVQTRRGLQARNISPD